MRVGPDGTPFRPEAFATVRARAEQLTTQDPEDESYRTDEGMQRSKERPLFFRGLRRAVADVVDVHPANEGCVAFCGWPVEFDGHHVVLVLQVQRDVHDGQASDEAARLASQCTRVEPFRLDESVLPLVTAIDGAVLLDTDGNCHAIGVILDGLASPKCSPERGARYNSAAGVPPQASRRGSARTAIGTRDTSPLIPCRPTPSSGRAA